MHPTQLVGAEHQTYMNRFHELSVCYHTWSPRVQEYWPIYLGFSNQIHGLVIFAPPTILEKTILLAASLTDEMVRTRTLTTKTAGEKRNRFDNNGRKIEHKVNKNQGSVKNFVMKTPKKKPSQGTVNSALPTHTIIISSVCWECIICRRLGHTT
ncbi:hypothetical protein R6Q59_024186 [Mikania micrantha]